MRTIGTSSALARLLVLALVATACRERSSTPPGQITKPAAASEPLPPSGPTGPVGTAQPLVIERVDPEGRWVFYCQVRRDTDGNGELSGGAGLHGLSGDAFEPLLWWNGTELPLDAFFDASRSGRYLAVREQGRAWLLDRRTGARAELPIAAPADPYSFASRAAFDADGGRLLYVRRDDAARIAIRELASGHETTLGADVGTIWRAWFDADGEHVWADVVMRDTDGDGRLELPHAETNLVVGACASPVATSSWGPWTGDRPVRFAVLDGALTEVAGGLAFVRGGVLERKPDGALVIRATEGDRAVASPGCRANVAHVDPEHERFFFVCQGQAIEETHELGELGVDIDNWAPLLRYQHGAVEALGIMVDVGDEDTFDMSRTVIHTRDGRRFDFVTGAMWVRPTNDVLATYGDKGLVILRSGLPCIVDLATWQRRCLDAAPWRGSSFDVAAVMGEGRVVMAPVGDRRGALVDIARERVIAVVPRRDRVHAVASDGRMLVGEPLYWGLLMGPLQWVRA